MKKFEGSILVWLFHNLLKFVIQFIGSGSQLCRVFDDLKPLSYLEHCFIILYSGVDGLVMKCIKLLLLLLFGIQQMDYFFYSRNT